MVCGLRDVRFSGSCHNRVKYSPLKNYPGSVGKSGYNVKWIMIVLVITCAMLMVFITYMVGTRSNSGSNKKPPVTGQGNNATLHPIKGNIDTALNLATTDTATTRETTIRHQKTTTNTPEVVAQESGEISKPPDISKLSRGSLIKLIDKIVEKIRSGHDHKETMQVQLLLLQDRLKRIDEAAKKKKKVMHVEDDEKEEEEDDENEGEKLLNNNTDVDADEDADGADVQDNGAAKKVQEKHEGQLKLEENDSGVTSTEEIREKEETRRPGPRTKENPQVQRMIDILETSPSTLDRYDFSLPLTWDFACFPKYLVGKRPTQVCVDNSNYDREFLEAITDEDTKQYKMLSVFIEYLETKFTMQVIDLGSNIGVFSLAAASLGRKVLAVEPCMKYILPFHKSVLQNRFQNQITFVTNALSDEYKLIQLINDPMGDPRKTRTVDVTNSLLNSNVIDPTNIARSVKLSDLEPALKYPEAIMRIDLNGDEARVFKESHYLLESGLVSSVLMEWRYDTSPRDYDLIMSYFSVKSFVPRLSVHGPRISYIGLRKYQPLIIWVKEA